MKFKHVVFRFDCGCRSSHDPTCRCGVDKEKTSKSDKEALTKCVTAFAEELKEKLLKKSESKSGWDFSEYLWKMDDIKKQLIEHVKKDDMIDVAAFAMFIWNRQNK